MLSFREEIKVKAPVEKVFEVISDFENYPSFHPDVKKANVLKRAKDAKEVEFTVSIMGDVTYTLKFALRKPDSIKWTMTKGNLFMKGNDGSWEFLDGGKGATILRYSMDASFSMLVTEEMAKDILAPRLKKMMVCFKKRAEFDV